MPYSVEILLILGGLALVFLTFAYLLVNARGLVRLFKPMSDGELSLDRAPGKKGAGRGAIVAALILHFVGWGIAGFVWLYLLADVRATAPDKTPQETADVVAGNGKRVP